MAEYIERSEVINEFAIRSFFYDADWGNKRFTPDDVKEILQSIPAADVRPVVHGHWIEHADEFLGLTNECSVCHAEGMIDGNFCPNCGADMREPPKEE